MQCRRPVSAGPWMARSEQVWSARPAVCSNAPPVDLPPVMSVFRKILRAGEGKKVRALESLVPDINALEPELERLSDDELAHKTVEFRDRLANARADDADVDDAVNDLLIESFAVVREAARRVIGQRHFDVQLMGGAALHFGWIAEM